MITKCERMWTIPSLLKQTLSLVSPGIALCFSAGTLIQSWGPILLRWCQLCPPFCPAWRENTTSVWMSRTSTWTSHDPTPPSQSLQTSTTPQMLKTQARSPPDPLLSLSQRYTCICANSKSTKKTLRQVTTASVTTNSPKRILPTVSVRERGSKMLSADIHSTPEGWLIGAPSLLQQWLSKVWASKDGVIFHC